MNYVELFQELMPLEKELKDTAAALTRLQKAIAKNTENGNLTELGKSFELFLKERYN